MPNKPVRDVARPIANSDNAPFVYFDKVAGFGVNAGVVLLELIAETIVSPGGGGGAETRSITTAHLRCSPKAALALRNTIDGVLKALAEAQHPIPAEKKN
jgi:hypothetical protein